VWSRRNEGPAVTVDVDQRALELVAQRVAFVRATVVRALRPRSARPGDAALVLPGGEIEGFVGGTCAESSVRLYSLHALEVGEPVLLRISPDAGGEPAIRDGKVTVHNPCLSGGELEIFLEPHRPPPRVMVLGDTPIGRSLVALGPGMGYDIEAVADPSVDEATLAGLSAVVVASHGRGEEPLLTIAVRAGVPYIGLVASPKRGAAVVAGLELAAAERKRIHTPAGLWLGARTAGEIAISILGEIVAALALEPGAEAPGPNVNDFLAAPEMAVDPICGMAVAAVDSSLHADLDGERHWFCGEGCLAAFEASPRRGERAS
jgi:xanthine dehydrogenase accessory factor